MKWERSNLHHYRHAMFEVAFRGANERTRTDSAGVSAGSIVTVVYGRDGDPMACASKVACEWRYCDARLPAGRRAGRRYLTLTSPNIQAYWCNHCCNGKTIRIVQPECVCL